MGRDAAFATWLHGLIGKRVVLSRIDGGQSMGTIYDADAHVVSISDSGPDDVSYVRTSAVVTVTEVR